jgi:hypothetical protein
MTATKEDEYRKLVKDSDEEIDLYGNPSLLRIESMKIAIFVGKLLYLLLNTLYYTFACY